MNIIKRNGSIETVKFDKISSRIKKQTYGLDTNFVDSDKIAITVINGLFENATTTQIDELISETSASMSTYHPDYSTLASRIAISSLHKNTLKSFSQTVKNLYDEKIVSEIFYNNVQKNKSHLDSLIDHNRDFYFDYFGYKTLEKAYLLKDRNGIIVERPQFMWMRVAVGIWGDDIENVTNVYNDLSQMYSIHGSPTLFNAGGNLHQLSSCFLLKIDDDSLNEIYKILSDTAKISKLGGGIGISISKVRAKNSKIISTNGISDGIVPMLKVYNETARYVNQSGRRRGSFGIYIETWHADIFDFIELKKNSGKEELRARDLFLGLWVSDLFFKQVNEDGDWWLMCPSESPDLTEFYGKDFDELYFKYVNEGKFRKKIKARELWSKILESQIETGVPYILCKDSINYKSNQKNVGVISSSNLCAEIVEYTSIDEQAVCNLGSIALPKFVENGQIDYKKLYNVAYQLAKNLDKVIDVNYYPNEETRKSNFRHRPIAVGCQGLADVYFKLNISYDSVEAKDINKKIFETIQFASISASNDLAKLYGKYETFNGSPLSQGIFQHDMWEDREVGTKDNKTQILSSNPIKLSGLWDWDSLRKSVIEHGVRNSLSTALMPTASTSNILGNTESFEMLTSNIYKRNTLSGEFIVINRYLVNELIKNGIWSDDIRKKIILNDGSIQNIDEIPQSIKNVYKIVWEMKMRDFIDQSADRGAFIDQTQSLNLFFSNINYAKLSGALLYGWMKGLKTCSYYTKGKEVSNANKSLGIDMSKVNVTTYQPEEELSCSLDNPEACMMCSG